LIAALGVNSVQIQDFASVKFKSASLTRLNDKMPLSSSDKTPSQIGKKYEEITLAPIEGRNLANVTVSAEPQDSVFLIDSLSVSPSANIIIETTPDGDLILNVQNQQSAGKITASGMLNIIADQCNVSPAVFPPRADEQITINASLARDSSLEFRGRQRTLRLAITAPTKRTSELFSSGRVPLRAITFERLDDSGHALSSLIKESICEITYPEYETIKKATVNSADFLALDLLDTFSIEEIGYDPNEKAIAITMEGVAGKIVSGSSNYSKDYRLTMYDYIKNDHIVIALFAAVCWVGGGTLTLYQLVKKK
jgi:hypothetical protein